MTFHIMDRHMHNTEHLCLCGVQSVLVPLLIHHSHITAVQVAMYHHQPVTADCLAASMMSQSIHNYITC